MTTVAFDVDGTLIDFHDEPQWHVIDTLRCLKIIGCTIVVWSGGGKSYAEMWVRKLFLEDQVDKVTDKPKEPKKDTIDICFDDEFVDFARVNVKLPTQP